MPKDRFEELVRKLEAERETAEEAKLITKREYPAVAQVREKFQQETVGLSQEYLTQLLEAIATDCNGEAKQLAGAAFSRTKSSLRLEWENAYDSTDPSQKNPDLYGSDYDHVKKRRHIEMEVRGVMSDAKGDGPHPEFDSIEVAVRSQLYYDIVKRKEIGIEFQGGTRDIAFTSKTGGAEESAKILLDEVVPPSRIIEIDDTMSKALHKFKKEVEWFWFNG